MQSDVQGLAPIKEDLLIVASGRDLQAVINALKLEDEFADPYPVLGSVCALWAEVHELQKRVHPTETAAGITPPPAPEAPAVGPQEVYEAFLREATTPDLSPAVIESAVAEALADVDELEGKKPPEFMALVKTVSAGIQGRLS